MKRVDSRFFIHSEQGETQMKSITGLQQNHRIVLLHCERLFPLASEDRNLNRAEEIGLSSILKARTMLMIPSHKHTSTHEDDIYQIEKSNLHQVCAAQRVSETKLQQPYWQTSWKQVRMFEKRRIFT